MTPITETNLEQATYALFLEWLKSFFDGGPHPVGTNPANVAVKFPLAAFGFGQSVLPQPLNPTPAVAGVVVTPKVGITMVFATDSGRQVSRRWETIGGRRQQVYYKPVRWNFWVRCETADDAGRALCLNAAQLLESILANSACTRALAQNGVHRVRPGSSAPVADNTYVLRLVPCAGTLRYAVSAQAT